MLGHSFRLLCIVETTIEFKSDYFFHSLEFSVGERMEWVKASLQVDQGLFWS